MKDVLVVEDETDTSTLLADLLALRGYRPEIARSALEAIAFLNGRAVPPGAIVLDLILPDMGGASFLALAREQGLLGSIPVIAVSGHQLRLAEIADSVYEAFLKPVSSHLIVDALERAAGGVPPRRGPIVPGT